MDVSGGEGRIVCPLKSLRERRFSELIKCNLQNRNLQNRNLQNRNLQNGPPNPVTAPWQVLP